MKNSKSFTHYLLLLFIPIMGMTIYFNLVFGELTSFSLNYFDSIYQLNREVNSNINISKEISKIDLNSRFAENRKVIEDLQITVKSKSHLYLSLDLKQLEGELLRELSNLEQVEEYQTNNEITSSQAYTFKTIHKNRLNEILSKIQDAVLVRVSRLTRKGNIKLNEVKRNHTFISIFSILGIIFIVLIFVNFTSQIFQKEYLTSVINKISDSLLIVDDFGKIIKMNSRAKDIFGVRRKGESILNIISTYSKSSSQEEMESNYISEDKLKIPILFTVNHYQVNRSTVHHVVLVKDMRIQNRLKADLASSEKLASVGQLAAGVAHELNTPLGAIYLVLGQIKETLVEHKIDDKDLFEMISDSYEAAKNMGRIISGLKLVSRDADQQKKIVDISSVIKSVLSICESNFLNKRIELKVNLPDGPAEVLCNPAQIGQVLVNLLNNSKDAVELVEHKEITINVNDTGENLLIDVVDNGPGVKVEDEVNMFEPFFTTKVIGKGTGLGLSINKGIIESHSGKLEYIREDELTYFKISIPKFKFDENDLGENL